jgi:hypothetical protein
MLEVYVFHNTMARRCNHCYNRNTRVGPKVSELTYKSCAKWKMLRGIYSAIYGEVNVSVCVEIKGDYIKK